MHQNQDANFSIFELAEMENNDFRDDPSLSIKSLRWYKVNLVRGSRAKLPDEGEYLFELVTTLHGNMLILKH